MLSLQTRPVAHKWIPVVGGIMILIGIIIALSAFNGETPMMYAYQIVILGAMLFGLGFLAIVIYALLSKKDTSEPAQQKPAQQKPAQQKPAQQKPAEYETEYLARNTNLFCQSCGTTLKLGTQFCGKCGTKQS